VYRDTAATIQQRVVVLSGDMNVASVEEKYVCRRLAVLNVIVARESLNGRHDIPYHLILSSDLPTL
jgi:hypothetical protein